ncbi:hypothetical protein [Thermoflexus sp.]|uniref:hypothetical protein n=1 Tax=Thermoflexus sp. TaxID=1969742 RepID=UPI002ADDCF81|nr:hypothetical protein [Thermoflexus sp.]
MKGIDARKWKTFRNLTWFLGLIALGISMILQGLLSPVAAGASVVLDGYRVTFLGVTYNSDQTSTWRYEVQPASNSTSKPQDLSHWVLALCTGHQVLDSDPKGKVGQDPTTGLWGIKWEQPLRTTDGPRVYTFVLSGWFAVGTVQLAVKAGRDPESGTIDGPSCEPPAPTPTPTLTPTLAPTTTPTPTPGIEPPTPAPTPDPAVESPTPTPTEPAPSPTPTDPPTPTPGIEPPTPAPTPIVYPPAPTPTPGVDLPPASPPVVTSPPVSNGASDLLPVTGVAWGEWSGWSLLLARLSGFLLGLGLAAHIALTWRSHSG